MQILFRGAIKTFCPPIFLLDCNQIIPWPWNWGRYISTKNRQAVKCCWFKKWKKWLPQKSLDISFGVHSRPCKITRRSCLWKYMLKFLCFGDARIIIIFIDTTFFEIEFANIDVSFKLPSNEKPIFITTLLHRIPTFTSPYLDRQIS